MRMSHGRAQFHPPYSTGCYKDASAPHLCLSKYWIFRSGGWDGDGRRRRRVWNDGWITDYSKLISSMVNGRDGRDGRWYCSRLEVGGCGRGDGCGVASVMAASRVWMISWRLTHSPSIFDPIWNLNTKNDPLGLVSSMTDDPHDQEVGRLQY
jgi:hypothetical protein